MRGQLGVVSATMAMRRHARFCWCFRFVSVVTKASNPSFSAASSNSPFVSFDQPRSYAVTTCYSAGKSVTRLTQYKCQPRPH